jgi:hypothetical protein
MIENLLEQFKENTKIHYDINYSEKASVRKGNKAVDKLFELAEKIKDNGQISEFAELLNDNQNKVDLWTAHILLERLKVKNGVAVKALDVIKSYANSDNANGYGEKLWLEQWLKNEENSKRL